MAKEIIFYAPLGRSIPIERIGGAEMGCRRTLDIYRHAGLNVICVEKPMRTSSTAAYAVSMAAAYARYVRALISHPHALAHIVGFYDKIIDIEYLLISTARALGHKSVYEIRNGGMIRIYRERDKRYKRRMLQLLGRATGVLCQGECYVDFLRDTLHRGSLLYPNFIDDEYLHPWRDRDFADGINMIYFGRIAPSKNVDAVIRCAALVQQRYPSARLHIVGAVPYDYERKLLQTISQCGLPDHSVTFHGHKDFEEIHRLLLHTHFFVFPSAEPNEGHSNSLTEAMGCGVVPVASTAGFNATICGIPKLVIDSTEPAAYADAIIKILDDGSWSRYSRSVHERVRNNFTKSIAAKALIGYISTL